jgi:hypothetical protein
MSLMLLSTTSRGGLVTWKPTSCEHATTLDVPFPHQIVPIQSLEPDGIVPIESLLAAPVVSISSLAPDMLMAVA